MLQRTRAEQAERVFLEFREIYPAAGDFAVASESAVTAVTERLGLHWRGPLLFRAAQQVADLGGSPPEDPTALTSLPGVGPYASAAWLSLHRNKRAVIVDSNVARWLARMTGRPFDGETRRKAWVLELADDLTPKKGFRAYNYAVLDFTMQVCRPKRPTCHACPLRPDCQFGSSLNG